MKQREFKFRVWDGTAMYDATQHPADFVSVNLMRPEHRPDPDRYKLMQYTGLKDKNGRDIYEGDCLGSMYEHFFVAWCPECKSYQAHCVLVQDECQACTGDIHWFELAHGAKIEVIGNIYENPELLNV